MRTALLLGLAVAAAGCTGRIVVEEETPPAVTPPIHHAEPDHVVCRVAPDVAYHGCNGEHFKGYDIFWPIKPEVCTGNPLERATCPHGTPCIVVLKPSGEQIDGECE